MGKIIQVELLPGSLASLATVMRHVPYKRTTLWMKWSKGEFPKPVKIGKNRIAFHADEIIEWIESHRQKQIDPPLPTGYKPSKFDKKKDD